VVQTHSSHLAFCNLAPVIWTMIAAFETKTTNSEDWRVSTFPIQ
jgi:hypothetical protein